MQDRRFLQFVVSNFLVFGDQQPASLAHKGKPNSVFCSGREMAAVALMLHAMLRERVKNGFAAVKIFVKIKNEVFRQR